MWAAPARQQARRAMIGDMLWIDREDVGPAALARMRRDGTVTPLSEELCAAPGVAPGLLRGYALAPWVPRRAAATGLAALWCYGLTPDMPLHVSVVVPRGGHPDLPVAAARGRWTFTTNPAAYARSRMVAGVRLVLPCDAAAAALGTGDLSPAIAAVCLTVTTGAASREELCEALSRPRPRAERRRAAFAWRAIQEALQGP